MRVEDDRVIWNKKMLAARKLGKVVIAGPMNKEAYVRHYTRKLKMFRDMLDKEHARKDEHGKKTTDEHKVKHFEKLIARLQSSLEVAEK